MTAQWWCQATLPSSQKQQDTTFCQGKASSHCSRRTYKITLIFTRSVRMGSKHNVRASILASSLSEVNLELHSSRASHSTGPPSLVLHSSRWTSNIIRIQIQYFLVFSHKFRSFTTFPMSFMKMKISPARIWHLFWCHLYSWYSVGQRGRINSLCPLHCTD